MRHLIDCFHRPPGRLLVRARRSIGSGLVLVAVGTGNPLHGQATDTTALRLTDVVVTINNDTYYDGVYRAQATSIACGKLDYMMPHRANAFVVEFPDETNTTLAVAGLTFDADTPSPGTITNSFYLKVTVRTPSGGTPPAFVVRANKPAFAEPGTAERFKAASRDSLVIVGKATSGTKVDVRVIFVCHPQP